MQRLTTRSIRTAQAIANREDFKTSGALRGEVVKGMAPYAYVGYLNTAERIVFEREAARITYIVYSYSTPIAWFTTNRRGGKAGKWHKVAQKFSMTTTKHQGNLYLV